MTSPWEIIPDTLHAAFREINNLQLLAQDRWQFRVETHPYPSTELHHREIRETIIPAQVHRLYAPACWVDAGTGRTFRGGFPMTRFEIAHPSGEPLVVHPGWLRGRLHEMQNIALGERRSREWEVFIAVPLLNEAKQWTKLLCYGAYASTDSAEHIPLRGWAEDYLRNWKAQEGSHTVIVSDYAEGEMQSMAWLSSEVTNPIAGSYELLSPELAGNGLQFMSHVGKVDDAEALEKIKADVTVIIQRQMPNYVVEVTQSDLHPDLLNIKAYRPHGPESGRK